jgi:hypothetical protein
MKPRRNQDILWDSDYEFEDAEDRIRYPKFGLGRK